MRLLFTRLVCACALLGLAAACAPAPPADTSAEDTAAVDAVRGAWMTAFNAADADALANLYTEDAVRMTPGMPTSTGRAAIRQSFADRFAMAAMTSTLRSDETQVMGDWAYGRGTYTLTVTPAGGEMTTTEGRYLVVLRRQADGAWKLARAIDNSPTPVPMPGGD